MLSRTLGGEEIARVARCRTLLGRENIDSLEASLRPVSHAALG